MNLGSTTGSCLGSEAVDVDRSRREGLWQRYEDCHAILELRDGEDILVGAFVEMDL